VLKSVTPGGVLRIPPGDFVLVNLQPTVKPDDRDARDAGLHVLSTLAASISGAVGVAVLRAGDSVK
jgi:hypothetical protein